MTGDFHNAFSPSIHALLDDLHHLIGPLFLVGGTVRNMLQKREFSNELNVLVQWSLSECEKRLVQGGHVSVSMGTEHNSLLLSLKGCERARVIAIATFRHRPDHPPTVEEDLFHRDLTVNAMAFAWPKGPLIDPFNGRIDLDDGRIRFVKGVRSLEEDALRALRFFRFAFQLEGVPVDADLRAAEQTLTSTVPRKKLRTELDRTLSLPLKNPDCYPLIQRFFQSPMAREVFADMATSFLCQEKAMLARRWKRAITMILEMTTPDKEEETPLLDLRWASLFHEMGEFSQILLEKGGLQSVHFNAAIQKISEILKKFRFSQRRQRRILHLLNHFYLDLMPTDRVLARLMHAAIPLEGLFRLLHAREVANMRVLESETLDFRGEHTTARMADSSAYAMSDCISKRWHSSLSFHDKSLLDMKLTKVLGRCCLLRQASQKPSPQDLAISGGEILDLVRRPQGAWVGEIMAELLEWIRHDPSRNRRSKLQGKVQKWVAKQQEI